jgi:hypothetical protein
VQENKNKHFASVTFTIFDEETIKSKICRIGEASAKTTKQVLPADFYTNIVIRVPVEIGVIARFPLPRLLSPKVGEVHLKHNFSQTITWSMKSYISQHLFYFILKKVYQPKGNINFYYLIAPYKI